MPYVPPGEEVLFRAGTPLVGPGWAGKGGFSIETQPASRPGESGFAPTGGEQTSTLPGTPRLSSLSYHAEPR